MAMYDNEPTMMGQSRPSATLVIRQGPQAGMSFPLIGNNIIIGREEGLDISLQDPGILSQTLKNKLAGGPVCY